MNTPAALKDIAPFWDAKITKTKSTTRLRWKSTVPSAGLQRLVLGAYDCCIVAEAYGFTNDYVIIDDGRMIEGEWPCYDCTKAAEDLHAAARLKEPDTFEEYLERFTQHYQEMHAQTPGA